MKPSVFRKLRPNKTWIVLGIAIVVGLLAAAVARTYLSRQMAAIEAKGNANKVKLVVAKRDLRRGEALSSDSLAVREIPAAYAHSGAMLPEEFERAQGQTLAFPVMAGEMVLWSLVEGKKAPTFSARVEVGRRAVTVPVDEISSISGMLEPGDLIDMLATLDQKGSKSIQPVLQRVQVMATGQRSIDDPRTGERRQYTTVTLDTTVEQARSLVMARESGKLNALLRNPRDSQPLPGGTIDLAQWMSPLASLASQGGGVPILYGGKGTLGQEGLNLAKPPLVVRGSPTTER
jgi:pilus assembly protein CpaB